MTFNNLNTIGIITVHSTFVKLLGKRDLYWENHSKTVEKIAVLPSWEHNLVLSSFLFFINLHAFTDFTQIHLLAYATTLLKQLTNKNTIKMVATRLCKREDLQLSPAICLSQPSVASNKLQNSTIIQWIGFLIQFCYMKPSCTMNDSNA